MNVLWSLVCDVLPCIGKVLESSWWVLVVVIFCKLAVSFNGRLNKR